MDSPLSAEVPPSYAITGGRADADRLGRQADVMAPETTALLSHIGVSAGWACLDLGCGSGQVTVELARMVGGSGRVLGVDRDREALEIARDAADGAGVHVQFVCGDALAPPVPRAAFDLGYARLLLSHLTEPVTALRQLRAAVRPGGVVAVEDLFTGTLRSDPPTVALDALQDIYAATVRFNGGDPTIGSRLPALMRAAGLTALREDAVVNPMTTAHQKLFLVELLDNMRPAILNAGAATGSELDRVREAVDEAARAPHTTFYQARIHQVWGRRPEANR